MRSSPASCGIERCHEVELARGADRSLDVADRGGGHVDVDTAAAAREKVEVLGVIVMRVRQEHRFGLPALAEPGVDAATELGDVEERLVVRARITRQRQRGPRDLPGLPLPERMPLEACGVSDGELHARCREYPAGS
jgi:hypothetical protein